MISLWSMTGGLGTIFSSAQFYAPLVSSLALTYGIGSATFTRATTATVSGYAENAVNGASQILLTIPAGIPRFAGARFLASNNTWSTYLADGTPIPDSQLLGYLSESSATNFAFPSGPGVTASTCTTAALTAASYTLSFKGTGSVTGTGGFVGTLNGTGANNRVSLTVTATATAATLTVTGSVTEMQLELGTFPTSLIATTIGAVIRNADILFYSSSNFSTSVGSCYAEFIPYTTNYQAGRIGFIVGTTTGGRLLEVDTNTQLRAIDSATNISAITVPSMAGIITKGASSWGSGIVVTAAGLSPNIQSLFAGMSSGNIAIGATNTGLSQLYGNIRNVRIWQTQLPNTTLQAITQ